MGTDQITNITAFSRTVNTAGGASAARNNEATREPENRTWKDTAKDIGKAALCAALLPFSLTGCSSPADNKEIEDNTPFMTLIDKKHSGSFKGGACQISNDSIIFAVDNFRFTDPGYAMELKKPISGRLEFDYKGFVQRGQENDVLVIVSTSNDGTKQEDPISPSEDLRHISFLIPDETVKVNLMIIGSGSHAMVKLSNIRIRTGREGKEGKGSDTLSYAGGSANLLSGAESVLFDRMDAYDRSVWEKADGWTNGDMFNCGWKADHISFNGGKMAITLDEEKSDTYPPRPYTSGEYRTKNLYGYGTLETRMKAAKGDGINTSVFFYTGPEEKMSWDEIDIEILGKDPTKLQTNYITDGKGGHEHIVDLGFDASEDFHSYSIIREEDRIVWCVDGKPVHSEDGSNGPLPDNPGRIIMNLWPGIGVDEWLKPFRYNGPVNASYDFVQFTPVKD